MGCTSCHIIPGYSCTGSLGSKSTCNLVSSTWRYTSIGAIAIIDKSFPDPVGWRWMTSTEGKSITSDIVAITGSWSIVAFYDGWAYRGSGYGGYFASSYDSGCG